ncbi:hypothetical protein HELRODRAFT_171809 [Helobdella robusta]|uniref:Uncharacterized protein n=1 Tax=Helobdella robusta TaxID=6412 RepID=T1F4Q0_HELRO|nr:hypothetical protein HELRODRAFT_171809 [Helobdella robusta]ESO05410.1 hypothetical protein HELRODRAFT_171809 [Helobdella robusta]
MESSRELDCLGCGGCTGKCANLPALHQLPTVTIKARMGQRVNISLYDFAYYSSTVNYTTKKTLLDIKMLQQQYQQQKMAGMDLHLKISNNNINNKNIKKDNDENKKRDTNLIQLELLRQPTSYAHLPPQNRKSNDNNVIIVSNNNRNNNNMYFNSTFNFSNDNNQLADTKVNSKLATEIKIKKLKIYNNIGNDKTEQLYSKTNKGTMHRPHTNSERRSSYHFKRFVHPNKISNQHQQQQQQQQQKQLQQQLQQVGSCRSYGYILDVSTGRKEELKNCKRRLTNVMTSHGHITYNLCMRFIHLLFIEKYLSCGKCLRTASEIIKANENK